MSFNEGNFGNTPCLFFRQLAVFFAWFLLCYLDREVSNSFVRSCRDARF